MYISVYLCTYICVVLSSAHAFSYSVEWWV